MMREESCRQIQFNYFPTTLFNFQYKTIGRQLEGLHPMSICRSQCDLQLLDGRLRYPLCCGR